MVTQFYRASKSNNNNAVIEWPSEKRAQPKNHPKIEITQKLPFFIYPISSNIAVLTLALAKRWVTIWKMGAYSRGTKDFLPTNCNFILAIDHFKVDKLIQHYPDKCKVNR